MPELHWELEAQVPDHDESTGGSYIEHKPTGRRTKIHQENGNFVFNLKVKRRGKNENQGFHRQVAALQTLMKP